MIRVRSDRGWRALEPDGAPQVVGESTTLRVEGLHPGARVGLGPLVTFAGLDGTLAVRLLQRPELAGHIGILTLTVDGAPAGEVEIVPDKMSSEQFEILRIRLQETWLGLVDELHAVTARRASLVDGPPSAVELWRRIERPVRAIRAEPRFMLVSRPSVGHLERARRPSEVSPALLLAHRRNRPGWTRRIVASTAVEENALVADVLRRLGSLAATQPDADSVRRATAAFLREPPFAGAGPLRPSISWGMRADHRYRQVHDVHRVLNRRRQVVVEGPGVLRLGVRSIPRLFEYWVYLTVLTAAQRRYGAPLRGLDSLATRIGVDHVRIDLAPGTSVEFPGDVVVAFEPVILASGRGWEGLELVPHPDPSRARTQATPDVVVYRRSPTPEAIVFDAKYVARTWVEREAAEVHEKYARIRRNGVPVVRWVLVAHPHQALAAAWAGYGHLPFVPGDPPPNLPLPEVARPAPDVAGVPTAPPRAVVAAPPGPSAEGAPTDLAAPADPSAAGADATRPMAHLDAVLGRDFVDRFLAFADKRRMVDMRDAPAAVLAHFLVVEGPASPARSAKGVPLTALGMLLEHAKAKAGVVGGSGGRLGARLLDAQSAVRLVGTGPEKCVRVLPGPGGSAGTGEMETSWSERMLLDLTARRMGTVVDLGAAVADWLCADPVTRGLLAAPGIGWKSIGPAWDGLARRSSLTLLDQGDLVIEEVDTRIDVVRAWGETPVLRMRTDATGGQGAWSTRIVTALAGREPMDPSELAEAMLAWLATAALPAGFFASGLGLDRLRRPWEALCRHHGLHSLPDLVGAVALAAKPAGMSLMRVVDSSGLSPLRVFLKPDWHWRLNAAVEADSAADMTGLLGRAMAWIAGDEETRQMLSSTGGLPYGPLGVIRAAHAARRQEASQTRLKSLLAGPAAEAGLRVDGDVLRFVSPYGRKDVAR